MDQSLEAIPIKFKQACIEAVFNNWATLAFLAYKHYRVSGAGFLIFSLIPSDQHLSYVVGAEKPDNSEKQIKEILASYDPETELVLMIELDSSTSQLVLIDSKQLLFTVETSKEIYRERLLPTPKMVYLIFLQQMNQI